MAIFGTNPNLKGWGSVRRKSNPITDYAIQQPRVPKMITNPWYTWYFADITVNSYSETFSDSLGGGETSSVF